LTSRTYRGGARWSIRGRVSTQNSSLLRGVWFDAYGDLQAVAFGRGKTRARSIIQRLRAREAIGTPGLPPQIPFELLVALAVFDIVDERGHHVGAAVDLVESMVDYFRSAMSLHGPVLRSQVIARRQVRRQAAGRDQTRSQAVPDGPAETARGDGEAWELCGPEGELHLLQRAILGVFRNQHAWPVLLFPTTELTKDPEYALKYGWRLREGTVIDHAADTLLGGIAVRPVVQRIITLLRDRYPKLPEVPDFVPPSAEKWTLTEPEQALLKLIRSAPRLASGGQITLRIARGVLEQVRYTLSFGAGDRSKAEAELGSRDTFSFTEQLSPKAFLVEKRRSYTTGT
jgi:hypothetical protein